VATESQQKQIDSIEKFESLLREAHDKVWWRDFVRLIAEKKLTKTNSLLSPDVSLTQRQEDVLRGEVMTLAWILALDQHGLKLNEERRNG
jgi:hypothetical protein